jgi:hypothetical protein
MPASIVPGPICRRSVSLCDVLKNRHSYPTVGLTDAIGALESATVQRHTLRILNKGNLLEKTELTQVNLASAGPIGNVPCDG